MTNAVAMAAQVSAPCRHFRGQGEHEMRTTDSVHEMEVKVGRERPGTSVGAIDDHPALLRGLEVVLRAEIDDLQFIGAATVREFLALRRYCDVVLLDLSLGDGSDINDNVETLASAGYSVLIYTQEHRRRPVARGLMAGASGVVLKNQPVADLTSAIWEVCHGRPYLNAEWAAVLEAEPGCDAPILSPRELQSLQLYATGMPLKSVARAMDVTQDTVRIYLLRVRSKYGQLGRGVATRTDYYIRAVEDGHLPSPTS